jgi:hypothetical protein
MNTDISPRPTFQSKMVNWKENEHAKRTLKDYLNWLQHENDRYSEEEAIDDLNVIMDEVAYTNMMTDGFALAKFAEREYGFDGDSTLVEIFDDFPNLARMSLDIAIEQWVKENNLTIPESVIGQQVTAKINSICKTTGSIVKIRPNRYEVIIGSPVQTDSTKGGYIVKWEDVITPIANGQ